ncbi:MAG TPA: rhomboid family intramembrane serine protease [Terracidiphilus sp.]
MARMGSTTLTFPGFHGATRRLVLLNAAAFFVFAIVQTFNLDAFKWLVVHMGLAPELFLFHGWLWQPFTYSLVQLGLLNTVFAVLSIWFLAGFLEGFHSDSWVTGLYAASILGTALAGVVLAFAATAAGMDLGRELLTGSFGGSFGLIIAIGVLYGDMEFTLFPIPVQIKARYLAVIYAVISVAMLFGSSRLNAFAQLGGGLAAWLYVRMAPRRGVSFAASEGWYGLRNRYYRWKRRRASRKFEVYMKKQGRTVRFDGQGRQLDEDDDPKRWN